MKDEKRSEMYRYERQVSFPPLGPDGQRRLSAGRVLVVGVGGLGSHVAELLARAGVGFLRIVDHDRVDETNLHRQSLYDEADAAAKRPKVQAAAAHLRRINSTVHVEAVAERLGAENVAEMGAGVDLIVDGTDNFPTRFIVNDFAVKAGVPWVFGGAVGAEGQVMTFLPPRRPCLRCVLDSPPPACVDPTCRASGVLGPVVAAIAAVQAAEAMKVLCGSPEAASPYLLKLDLWANTVQRLEAERSAVAVNCPCCVGRRFEYLHA
jgi:adenylyltransferase/sulfurtransferase